jgi:hypothetical protein
MKQKALTATAAVIGLSVLSFAPTAAQARIAAPSTIAPPAVAPAPAQTLTWSACTDPGLAGLECSSLQVPLDHKNPTGPLITLALSRVVHTGATG